MNYPAFKLGSTVRMKGGGIDMKVLKIDHHHEILLCSWGDTSSQQQYFKFGMLDLLPVRHLGLVK